MSQTEIVVDECKDIYNEETLKNIAVFLSKKRRAILEALYRSKKLSHRELADAVGTSVASLSNILIKFEQFEYKLFDSITSGKYRYYFLTELGKAYVEKWCESEKNSETKRIIQHEAVRLIQDAKECLTMFQSKHEDDWEIVLDNELIMRVNCYEPSKWESEVLVSKFLEDIEKVLLSNDETFIEKILKLLSGNNILQGRLTVFMEKFSPFAFVLLALEEDNTLQVYELLEALVEKDIEKAKNCSEKLGWHDEFDKVSVAICEIVDRLKDKNTQDFYKCYYQYLAGNKELSAFLARVSAKAFESKAS